MFRGHLLTLSLYTHSAVSQAGLLISTGRPVDQPAGQLAFFINFGRPKLAKIKNVQKIRVFPSYLDALSDN